MHSHRSLAVGLLAVSCLAFFVRAPKARADTPAFGITKVSTILLDPNASPLTPPETAVKSGDTVVINVEYQTTDGATVASADFSPLGASIATSTGSWSYSASAFAAHLQTTVGSAASDGLATIPLTLTTSTGTTTATTTRIRVDTTPPTLTISDLHFSTSTPRAGDTLYLSGKGSGTGSAFGVKEITETLAYADGTSYWRPGMSIDYANANAGLAAAVASSTDGSFTHFPITLSDSPDNALASADTFVLTITATDGAGNSASTSITAALPHPPPPALPSSSAPLLSAYDGVREPYNALIGFPDLSAAKYLVATGTLTSFVAPLANFKTLSGTESFSFALVKENGQRLDCTTPEKTADEWGITHTARDPYAPFVTIAPFTGSACAVGTSPVYLTVFKSGVPDGNLGIMGDIRTVSTNFAAYAAPVVPKTPAVDSVLFIPGTEASRLYYRDSFGVERQVWEPDLFTDIPYLAMNADGMSKYRLYTKDIIGTFWGNDPVLYAAAAHTYGADTLEVYSGLESYLNSLTASSTLGMREWRAYPYDWRYDVRDIVNNGTQTETGSTVSRVYLEEVVDQMASSSATGKVAIVAHSNGGLIAKALMQKLAADGKGSLVDKLVMVGSPQWGTPSALGAILHGDNFSVFPWFVMNHATARAEEVNMMDPYDLLPSAAYFAHVADPVATFSATSSPSADYASAYGSSVTSSSALDKFLEDTATLDASVGDARNLTAPQKLRSDLVDAAAADHASLDAWTPPPSLSVTAIAGWGQITASGYQYTSATSTSCASIDLLKLDCSVETALRHVQIPTQDGDGTVVSPSALGNTTDAYYFDSEGFFKNTLKQFVHQDLTSATPVQKAILDLIEGKYPVSEQYILSSKPTNGLNPLTVISSHSPVNLLVTDASGNQSGVLPLQSSDFSGRVEHIPGSFVSVMGDEEYVYLPQSGTYQATATGYGNGPAAIEVGTAAADGTITTTQTFSSLPVTSGTKLSLSVEGSTGATSDLTIDEQGDGSDTASVAAGDSGFGSYEPPTPPPAPAPAPAVSSGAGSGSGSSNGAISIPYAAPALLPVLATTTPLEVATEMPPLATTTSPLATTSPIVATTSKQTTARAQVLKNMPPSTAEAVVATSSQGATITDLSQTASAINALSQPGGHSIATELYDWCIGLWSRSIHFLARIL